MAFFSVGVEGCHTFRGVVDADDDVPECDKHLRRFAAGYDEVVTNMSG